MGRTFDGDLPDLGTVPICKTCRSERVVHDAWACWNPTSGLWELECIFDHAHCHACDGEASLVWKTIDPIPRQRIRELNDQFRTEWRGNGSIMFTVGVQEHGKDFLVAAAKAVRSFNGFSKDNDPWEEHDCGSVEVAGEKVFWKIDYYTPDLAAGSDNPANEGETHRVLTIMLASEY